MDCDGIWWFLKSWRIPKSPWCVSIQSHGRSWRLDDSWGVPPWLRKPPYLSTYGFLGGCCSELFQLDVPSELPLIFSNPYISYRSYPSLRVTGVFFARHGGSWGHKVMPHGPVERTDLVNLLKPFATGRDAGRCWSGREVYEMKCMLCPLYYINIILYIDTLYTYILDINIYIHIIMYIYIFME